MRPLSLKLKGFRGYAEQALDFSGITSVLISGPTGAGKSAIPGAILLALTGENNSSDPSGHVKKGADLCHVEFTFEHAGSTYRTIHTDSLKTARKKTDRQFAVSDGKGGWIPKTGKSIAETNAVIQSVIGQTYNELTCGPFSLQNQSGRFLDPGEMRIDGKVYTGRSARLQVTIKMLGLQHYEALRVAAAQETRDLDAKAETLEAQVAAADTNLVKKAETETALSHAETTIQTARQTAQDSQGLIEALTGQIGTLQAEIEAGRRQCAGLAADQKTLMDLGASRQAKDATRTRYRGILDHRAEIEAKAAESEALGKQSDTLRVELAGIEAEIRGLEGQKTPAEFRLKAAKEKSAITQDRTAEIQRRLAARGDQEGRVARLKAARAEWDTVADGIHATDEAVSMARSSRDAMTATNAEAQKKRGEILAEEKKVKADVAGLVPLIQGHEKRTAVMEIVPCIGAGDLSDRCPLLADARGSVMPLAEARERHAHLCAWQRPTLPEIQRTETLDTSLRVLAVQKVQQQGRLTALDSEIRTLTPAEAELAALETLAGEVPRLEAEGRTVKTELDGLIAEVTRLEIEAAGHRGGGQNRRAELVALGEQIQALTKWVSLVPEIALAERESPILEEDLARIGEQIEVVSKRCEEASIAQIALAVKDKALVEARGNLEAQRINASRARADESVAVETAAKHRATLASLERLSGERKAAAKEAAELRARHSLLVALAEAYKQIPVMILENAAVPVLEEEANRFLARTTTNRMSVRLETQREVKSRDTLADGLEIYIRDWRGERAYDDYSGGQRFELALAFRVAWTKLQERRSGVGVDCLVVDEGFSALSFGDLESVMTALRELQGQFSFFAVISHVEAMAELFPTTILVTGGATDSCATLVRR